MWDAFPLVLQLWKSRKQLQPSREQIFAEGGEPCGGEAGTLTWPPHSFSFRSNFIDRTERSDSAPVTREQIGKLRPAGLAQFQRGVIPSAGILARTACLSHMALLLLIQYASQ